MTEIEESSRALRNSSTELNADRTLLNRTRKKMEKSAVSYSDRDLNVESGLINNARRAHFDLSDE